MKYAILIGDGMADFPLDELEGRTPLDVADVPNMDEIVRRGVIGMVSTTPEGYPPGSYSGNMSLLGYDPRKYYCGRAPIEAANIGVELGDDDVAFRCNCVTLADGKMDDFSAGKISTEEAAELIAALDETLGRDGISFHAGTSYRHLTVFGPPALSVAELDALAETKCTPPHDISGQAVEGYLPSGNGARLLRDIMEKSVGVLNGHPVNKRRERENKPPANSVWFWGQGRRPRMPLFRNVYGVNGAVISAVDLVKGFGRCLGLDVVEVPGATGYLDTNYAGKGEYALKVLEGHDWVYLHVESPDEASHEGSAKLKIRAIEDFDRHVVGTVLRGIETFGDYRIMVLPDHITSIATRTHAGEPFPYAMAGTGITPGGATEFSEKSGASAGTDVVEGHTLMGRLVNRSR